MDAFKFDTILSSLHDLQHAKSINEVELSEEHRRRKQLESQVQKAAGDLRHASVKHSNLRQNSQITEQKLTQLEELIKTLEQLNHSKSCKIDEMNKKILIEQETQHNDLLQFENTMSELSNKFRTAPKTYSEDNLDRCIKDFQQEIHQLQLEVSNMKDRIYHLSNNDVEKKTKPSGFVQLEEEQTSLVHVLFTDEYKASEESKKEMKDKELKLKEQYSKLEQELKGQEIVKKQLLCE